MMAAVRIDESSEFLHVPVMLEQVVSAFRAPGAGVIVDATAGGAGHAKALLEALPDVTLLAFDRDPIAVDATRAALAPFGERASVTHGSFDEIEATLGARGIERIDGLLADLGVSSEQLNDAARGMSFRTGGPLDMRMDPTRGETARELIERMSQEELADLIYELGDERASRRIARCVKQALSADRLSDTLDLRRAVVRAVGPRRFGGIDPATRTFQALRIAVNDELGQLRTLLSFARRAMSPGGTAAFISFHSLEDRAVKREFTGQALWQPVFRKPLTPDESEVRTNPRSRSAKLRIALRQADDAGEADDE